MEQDQSTTTVTATFPHEENDTIVFQPLEILNAITSGISAVANVLIVYVIFRYSTMRTKPNIYLANWCICNFLVMILAPPTLKIFEIFDSASEDFVCFWEESLYGFLVGNLMFVVIYLLDWYIVTYCKQGCSVTCRNVSIYIIIITWIIILGLTIASITFCLQNLSQPLTLACFIFGFFIVFIVIILVYILRFIQKRMSSIVLEKSTIELILVSSYFLCWLLNWVSLYMQLFLRLYINEDFESMTFFIGYSNAWIMVILLYYFDKSFKVCFRNTFRLKLEDFDSNRSNNKDTVVL